MVKLRSQNYALSPIPHDRTPIARVRTAQDHSQSLTGSQDMSAYACIFFTRISAAKPIACSATALLTALSDAHEPHIYVRISKSRCG